MYTAGLQPNVMTYVTLLSSYAELGNWQYAMQVLNHMCRSQVWFLQILLHLFLQTGLSKHAHTGCSFMQCVMHCVQLDNKCCCDPLAHRHCCKRFACNPVQRLDVCMQSACVCSQHVFAGCYSAKHAVLQPCAGGTAQSCYPKLHARGASDTG